MIANTLLNPCLSAPKISIAHELGVAPSTVKRVTSKFTPSSSTVIDFNSASPFTPFTVNSILAPASWFAVASKVKRSFSCSWRFRSHPILHWFSTTNDK